MTEDPSRKRLGRGLAALIGEIDRPETPARVVSADGKVPIELIARNPRNPRRAFGEAELSDLAQSIREHGLVQPVVVRPAPGHTGRYEIIAGERRWRAAQLAGLNEIPIILRDVDDRVALEIAIVENVQRSDLNPIEEAMGYQRLIEDHSYTQADLGQVIGKSRSHVANTLRLLKLPADIRDMLVEGVLSAGHARTLVTAADPGGLARKIVEGFRFARRKPWPRNRNRRQNRKVPPRGRTPTRWRWRSCSATSPACRCLSATAKRAASSRSPTGPWSSSTISAAVSVTRWTI